MASNNDPREPAGIDPLASARQHSKPQFPKRFYRAVDVVPDQTGFGLTLDGRPARTPARRPLSLPTQAAANALAREWTEVAETIDPRLMPYTRLANSVIDGVDQNAGAVLDEVVRYAASDLLLYRADQPAELVRQQEAAWTPILDWSLQAHGTGFAPTKGIVFLAQPEETLARFAAALRRSVGIGPGAAFRLGSLHVMTTLTGSALLALAVASRRLSVDDAWAAAHVDEDFQIAQWGEDTESAERRLQRWVDMKTAAALYALVSRLNGDQLNFSAH